MNKIKSPRIPLYERTREVIRGRYLDGTYEVLPSLRDLSLALEVNHATISRALRDLEEEGMLEVVPRKGVFPTSKKRSTPLKNGNSSSYVTDRAIIEVDFLMMFERSPWQSEIAQVMLHAMKEMTALEEYAHFRIAHTLVSPSAASWENVSSASQARRSRGVVCAGYGYSNLPQWLEEDRGIYEIAQRMPLVLAGMPHPRLHLDCVYCDPRPQLIEFLEECFHSGLRRFDFLGSGSVLPNQRERQDCFAEFLLRHGLRWQREFLDEAPVSQLVERLRALEKLPEVVVATNLNRAFALALEAQRRGLKLPDDLRLLCFSSSSSAAQPLMAYADVVLQDEAAVGRAALEMLAARLDGNAARLDEDKKGGPEYRRVAAHFISRHRADQ